MIITILFIASSIISLISLFYSVSTGYFDYRMYEKKLYTKSESERMKEQKEQIIEKYYEKVFVIK